MSNPCINRWGLNSLWRHYWYSDSRYAVNLQHDKLVTELVSTYLNYGSDFSTQHQWNSFWYKTNPRPSKENINNHYRWVSIYSHAAQETSTYRLRKDRENETFETRISILKFQSWIVFNLYWFQPDKKRAKRLKMTRLRHRLILHTQNSRSTSPIVKFQAAIKNFQSLNLNNVLTYEF